MTLINCHGIWLFSVNAISHAECLVNGCLPIAGQHKPSFSLPLSFPVLSSRASAPLLSPPLAFHKRFAVLSQQEQTRAESSHTAQMAVLLTVLSRVSLPCEDSASPRFLTASVQRQLKVASSSFFSLIYSKCVAIRAGKEVYLHVCMPLRPNFGLSLYLQEGKKDMKNQLSSSSELVFSILMRFAMSEGTVQSLHAKQTEIGTEYQLLDYKNTFSLQL